MNKKILTGVLLLTALLIIVCPPSCSANGGDGTEHLENQHLLMTFDQNGALIRLQNPKTGRIFMDGQACAYTLTVNTDTGDIWKTTRGQELTLRPSDAKTSTDYSQTDKEQILTVRSEHEIASGKIIVTQIITLPAASLTASFRLLIDNQCANAVVTKAETLPLCGVTGDSLSLLWPDKEGKIFSSALSAPNARDLSAVYPSPFSMQYIALFDDSEGLYYGVHDAGRQYKSFSFSHDEAGSGAFSCTQWPFVGAGQSAELAPTYLGLTGGGFYSAADIYRQYLIDHGFQKEYAPSARSFTGVAASMMANYSNRYNVSYTGGTALRKDMAMIAREHAAAYGTPLTIFLGWHEKGFDSRYPDYAFLSDYGGADGFKQATNEVHAVGGKAIMYMNLHIADTQSKWYGQKNGNGIKNGDACAILTRHGSVLHETYGTGLDYVAMCPAAPEWQSALIAAAKRLREGGADGLWFDQMMEMPANLCYNKAHGHSSPATAYAEGYDGLMAQINAVMQAGGEDFLYCCEGVSDAYIQSIDLCGLMWARLPGSVTDGAAEITRYTMPAKFFGLPSSGGTPGSERQYKHAWVMANGMLAQSGNAFVKRYSALCQKYPAIYFDGRYRDRAGLQELPENIMAGVIVSETEKLAAVQLFNDAVQEITFTLALDPAALQSEPELTAADAETGAPLVKDGTGWIVTIPAGSAKAVLISCPQ